MGMHIHRRYAQNLADSCRRITSDVSRSSRVVFLIIFSVSLEQLKAKETRKVAGAILLR
jgi:hypothetical protein